MKTKNITLSMDEELILEGRRYAQKHHTSLNALIRDMLAKTVKGSEVDWTEECFRKMDAAKGHSAGRTWRRDDLHEH